MRGPEPWTSLASRYEPLAFLLQFRWPRESSVATLCRLHEWFRQRAWQFFAKWLIPACITITSSGGPGATHRSTEESITVYLLVSLPTHCLRRRDAAPARTRRYWRNGPAHRRRQTDTQRRRRRRRPVIRLCVRAVVTSRRTSSFERQSV